jgi:hypothetical protein
VNTYSHWFNDEYEFLNGVPNNTSYCLFNYDEWRVIGGKVRRVLFLDISQMAEDVLELFEEFKNNEKIK